ncbi:hypothetical protein MTY414_00070 [Mycolicibacterium mageritense]|nr:hypothetical protein MTY414_00070 [Mycolicibacterium mageritense]
MAEVCRAVHGAYPTEVLAQAAILRDQGQLDGDPTYLQHTPASLPVLESAQSLLPLPHPRDFEWRFSRKGCAIITDAVLSTVRTRDAPVALLGTSGYAEHIARSDLPLNARLFERRAEACTVIESVGRVTVTMGDIAQTWHLFPASFDCIIADPPWYPTTIETFIRAAAGLLAEGGTLFLCAPGLTTRPGLPAERREMLRVAAAHGLILDQLVPRALEYESPPFELSALRASGLDGFDPYWRLGDIFAFRRLPGARITATAEPGEQLSIDDSWQEVTLGRARIRVNTSPLQPTITDQILDSVLPGDVLDSVSSRDPRRGVPNVWTTTNRVYSTKNPKRLLMALQRHIRGDEPTDTEYAHAAQKIVNDELYGLRLFGIE